MELISSKTRLLLALSMLKGVGPAALKKVATIADFWEMAIGDLSRAVPQIARAVTPDGAWMNAKAEADKQVAAAERHRARILSPLDADYPRLLAETKDDPFLLYVQGAFAKDPDKSVAVIGTREPTSSGEIIARRLTHTFVSQGWSIVSGLAIGCDSIAHRAALDAGGHTVAVLAHGLQMIAPSRHKGLAQDILNAGGALVSEYPFGQGVQAQQFVKRDRTQAGMARGVVMIQSDVKGGSLHASRASLDYGRWLAVPYPTPKDLQFGEPKVQGNLVIADGTDAERSALLRCPVRALSEVRVLRDKVDILRLAGAPVGVPVELVELSVNQSLVAVDDDVRDAGVPDAVRASPDKLLAERRMRDEEFQEDDERPSESAAPVIATEEPVLSLAEALEAADPSTPAVESEGQGSANNERVRPSKGLGKRSVRYHVALLDPHSSGELRIVKLPASWIEDSRNELRASGHDVDFVVVLATRLEHIQARVDEVRRTYALVGKANDRVKSLQVQFFVEDALMHMKRTVDDLGQLQSSKALHVDLKVCNAKQLSLLEAKEAKGDGYLDLVPTLDQIVKALPLSVAMPSGSRVLRSTARRDAEVDIAFHDLVHSFNGLVTQALGVHVEPDADSSRDHATHL